MADEELYEPVATDVEDISRVLLGQSFKFCSEFVPTQLESIMRAIDTANDRMTNARSADDYLKMAAATKNLYASYSHLMEQATIVFMSSYRPLMALRSATGSDESVTVIADDNDPDCESNIDLDNIQDDYRPYIDD